MSRKWERMVQKNTKQLNKQRKASGHKNVIPGPDHMDVFYGRSWFLPTLLIACSLFFGIVSVQTSQGGGKLFWFTVIAYGVLAVLYFMRRPYIKVGRTKLSTRRMGVEKFFDANDIETIAVLPGSVTVQFKGKKTRWVLSKFQNLYNIPQLAERMKLFAAQNNIAFDESNA